MHSKILMAAVAIALPACAFITRLHAQDVTVTPLEWVMPKDASNQLPVPADALEVYFPHDLRNTPDFGYALVELFVNEKGEHLRHSLFATLPAYELAASERMRDWAVRPARRAGQPVNAFAKFTVIFNPASAGRDKADATARLLQARLVVDPALKPKKGEKAPPPTVVWAVVSLDAAGKSTALKDAPASLGILLEKSLQDWRFSPARRGGIAVASEVRVPIIVVPPRNAPADDYTPAQAVTRVSADYPEQMRTSGLRGEVLVNFVVDAKGQVTEAHVVHSLNPAFEQPALDAIYQWKFTPALRAGAPVSERQQVTLTFRLLGKLEEGASGITVEKIPDQSQLPPEYRYDVAPKPRGLPSPVYPYALLRDEFRGKARVSFVIGTNGQVISSDIVSADRPEFGAALQAAVEDYKFEPALRAGRPTPCLYSAEQNFSNYDSDRLIFHKDRTLLTLERKHPEQIVSANRLDAKLKPISMQPPAFPLALKGRAPGGSALVEVLIDEEGRVRLPRLVSASDPAFGYAAIQAVASWRFEPPKSDGKLVVVRVRVPFEFSGPSVGGSSP